MSLELLFEYTELMDQRIKERDFKSKGHDCKGSVSFSLVFLLDLGMDNKLWSGDPTVLVKS